MAKLTKAQREWKPNTPKKQRSTRLMFASVVLMLEAFVALFLGLALFGLKDKDATYLIAAGVLAVLMILACAVVRKPWGPAFGWILQLLLIAGGFWEPSMFVVGILFAVAWWYALYAGAKIDRENTQRAKAQAAWDAAHPVDAAAATPGEATSGEATPGAATPGKAAPGENPAADPAAPAKPASGESAPGESAK